MNYKFPLLNLVTRGHLSVKNPIATQRFIENLDNDSCKTILENLLFVRETKDCVRILEDIQETYELKNDIRQSVSNRILNEERDNILLRESDAEPSLENLGANTVQNVNQCLTLLKTAGVVGAVYFLLRIPDKEREKTIMQLKNFHEKEYQMLRSSPILRKILPNETGFINRSAKSLWTFKNHLNGSDKEYLRRIGRYGRNAVLIAAGITSAIIGIGIAYKEFFSEEARKCNHLSGKKRTMCMLQAQITAAQKAKQKSEDALMNCDSAKDPQDCRYKIKCEIRSWTRKMEEAQRKLARLEKVNQKAYPQSEEKTTPVNVSPAYDPFSEPPAVSQATKPVAKKVPETPKKKDPFGDMINNMEDLKVSSSNPFG